ncbi:MAG: [Fe-Fe] hydrogenase large subunit C-terminal domain-containing protein, partial [Spirochaetia bacterium]
MHKRKNINFVETIKERCRKCYTCVRECPAKAIRIVEGQAEIITERCIGCGNCVRVCSQNAKVIHNTENEVASLLKGPTPVSACLAPSFPAAFPGVYYRKIIGGIRSMGFTYVHEVAFGADLVAAAYKKLMDREDMRSYIGTTCPALVNYVECYYPELIPQLAPVVSPMAATASALHAIYGGDLKTVFIGPCLAKKGEDPGNDPRTAVDAVITFSELKNMMEEMGILLKAAEESVPDPPHGNLGGLFPVSGGILQAAEIEEDLVTGNVVSADGRSTFVETIKEYSDGDMAVRLLEILCCSGCIMGSGMGCDTTLFRRRGMISQYVRERTNALDYNGWKQQAEALADLDLSRRYEPDDQRLATPSKEEIEKVLKRMGKTGPEDELNCGACGYETCVEHATAVLQGLAENEMCLPNTIDQLNRAVDDLEISHKELAKAQEALLQSEKLASMGQLAAGIAHELNNPLGVVLMYAHLLLEQEEENKDLKMITEQAGRCKEIVSGLLHFARQNKVLRRSVDVNELIDRSLRSVQIPDTVDFTIRRAVDDQIVEVDQDQIIQVITNLVTNACDAMPEGGELFLTVSTKDNTLELTVEDSGTGIPEENLKKI